MPVQPGRGGRPPGAALVASRSTTPSRSFGRHAAERPAVRPSRPAPRLGHPLLAACRSRGRSRSGRRRASGRRRTRSRCSRTAGALRVQRPVDRVDDDHPGAARLRTAARRAPRRPAGSRSPPACSASSLATTAALGLVVDHGRVVAALAPADDRLALVAGGQRGECRADVVGDLPAEAEPALVDQSSSGLSRNPLHSFGKKYVDFCGMTAPASATARTCSTRRRAQEKRRGRSRPARPAPSPLRARARSGRRRWRRTARRRAGRACGARIAASSTAASIFRTAAGTPGIAMLIAARSRSVQMSAGRSAPRQTAKAIVSAGTALSSASTWSRRALDLLDRRRRTGGRA